VAESERLAYDNVAIAEVIVVVKIRTAKTSRLNSDLDFIAGRFRKLTLFLHDHPVNECNMVSWEVGALPDGDPSHRGERRP